MTDRWGEPWLTTEAGRKLFTDNEPMDMWESNGVLPADIRAIEAEVRKGTLDALQRTVNLILVEGEKDKPGPVGEVYFAGHRDACSKILLAIALER